MYPNALLGIVCVCVCVCVCLCVSVRMGHNFIVVVFLYRGGILESVSLLTRDNKILVGVCVCVCVCLFRLLLLCVQYFFISDNKVVASVSGADLKVISAPSSALWYYYWIEE
jgi:hypothetical protein